MSDKKPQEFQSNDSALEPADEKEILSPIILHREDKIEIKWDPRGLWCLLLTRKDQPLLMVFGHRPEGAIVESQFHLESLDADMAASIVDSMSAALQRFAAEGHVAHYKNACDLATSLRRLAPWDWLNKAADEIDAKLVRHHQRPRMLLEGIIWHARRLFEYAKDIKEELGGRNSEAASEEVVGDGSDRGQAEVVPGS